jgi:hypothetical protein
LISPERRRDLAATSPNNKKGPGNRGLEAYFDFDYRPLRARPKGYFFFFAGAFFFGAAFLVALFIDLFLPNIKFCDLKNRNVIHI